MPLFKKIFILTSLFSFVCSAQKIDTKSKKIIAKTIASMGGYNNWNKIKYLEWQQSGKKIYWNKHNNNIRVENKNKNLITLFNANNLKKAKAYQNEKEITDVIALKKIIKKDINYWKMSIYKLAMPWKLEDPGISIKYLKKGKTEKGLKAKILEITYNHNKTKYWIYVTKDNLIKQCDFFKNKENKQKNFSLYWHNYQKLNNILISFNNPKGKGPRNLKIKNSYDSKIFIQL